jgi:penicillin-binding protein 1B
VVTVALDKNTNLIATASCLEDFNSAFIAGSEPQETCDHADQRNLFQKIFGGTAPVPPPVNQPARVIPPNQSRQTAKAVTSSQPAPQQSQPATEPKKKGFWGKVGGIFGGGDKNEDKK